MPWPQASAGVTLLEMAMAMMIVAVLSVGVSGIIKVGVEHTMAERQHQNMQMIAMNLVDDLRHDLRTADSINALGAGSNSLVMQSNGKVITYALNAANKQITRKVGGVASTKIYNDPGVFKNLQVQCTPTCFQIGTDQSGNPLVSSSGVPKEIMIPNLSVNAVLPAGNLGTSVDQAFGVPSFHLKMFSFNVAAATEFQ
jgi:prepilin-type N-terminal cleavage/methylation domain-containing protein